MINTFLKNQENKKYAKKKKAKKIKKLKKQKTKLSNKIKPVLKPIDKKSSISGQDEKPR